MSISIYIYITIHQSISIYINLQPSYLYIYIYCSHKLPTNRYIIAGQLARLGHGLDGRGWGQGHLCGLVTFKTDGCYDYGCWCTYTYHIYVDTYIHPSIHTYIHPSIHPSIHPYIHTYIAFTITTTLHYIYMYIYIYISITLHYIHNIHIIDNNKTHIYVYILTYNHIYI